MVRLVRAGARCDYRSLLPDSRRACRLGGPSLPRRACSGGKTNCRSSAMIPAAFFDLDGTLLPLPSLERRFVRFLLRRGEIGFAQEFRWLSRFLQQLPRDIRAATAGNKAYLAGVPLISVEEWAESLERKPLPFFEEALRRLEWHAAAGHRIFLVSGTLAPLAKIAAAFLPALAAVCAT